MKRYRISRKIFLACWCVTGKLGLELFIPFASFNIFYLFQNGSEMCKVMYVSDMTKNTLESALLSKY